MKQVLLVGNGPSILDEPLGPAIDAFNGRVVRFNEFILEPKECTGSRVDMWVVCWKSHADNPPVESLHPELKHLITHVPRKIQYKDKETRYRSTGIGAMFWFLEQGCGVVLHGFDHFALDRRKNYFDHDRGSMICRDYVAGKPYHDKDREMVEEAVAEGRPVRYFRG